MDFSHWEDWLTPSAVPRPRCLHTWSPADQLPEEPSVRRTEQQGDREEHMNEYSISTQKGCEDSDVPAILQILVCLSAVGTASAGPSAHWSLCNLWCSHDGSRAPLTVEETLRDDWVINDREKKQSDDERKNSLPCRAWVCMMWLRCSTAGKLRPLLSSITTTPWSDTWTWRLMLTHKETKKKTKNQGPNVW